MTPEQIKEKLDKYFGMTSSAKWKGVSTRRYILTYLSPTGVELFSLEIFSSAGEWLLGSITHSLSSQLEHLNNVVLSI